MILVEKPRPTETFTAKVMPGEPFDVRLGTYIDIPVVDSAGVKQYALDGALVVVGGYWLQGSFFLEHSAPPSLFVEHAPRETTWLTP